jgi:hypothetical protein
LIDGVRAAIPLGVAVVIGVLAGVGIDEDARTRLLRNTPGGITIALAVAMAGVTLPLVWRSGWAGRVIGVLGAVAILGGSIWALDLGANSLSDRDNPTVMFTTQRNADDPSRVTAAINAEASFLRSDEAMLVRVLALRWAAHGHYRDICRRADPDLSVGDDRAARLILWHESGPNSSGHAGTIRQFELSRDRYVAVCYYVALRDRDTRSVVDDRLVWGVTRLKNAGRLSTQLIPSTAPTGAGASASPKPTTST